MEASQAEHKDFGEWENSKMTEMAQGMVVRRCAFIRNE